MVFDWWFKALILFNSFWGIVFLVTSLVGQYQSYVTYRQTYDAINAFGEKGNLELNEMKGGQ